VHLKIRVEIPAVLRNLLQFAMPCLLAPLLLLLQAQVFPPEQLLPMVAQCDYVVLSTPYTPDTHQLIDAAAIAAMKPNAVFINVGRGKCVDEEALVKGGCLMP
jgi:phosphoglycerate dehydrogenase-like enzyme